MGILPWIVLEQVLDNQQNQFKCLYRRDKENMPGSAREVLNAEEEGVEFLWKSSPKDFIGNEDVSEILCSRMQLSEPDCIWSTSYLK